MTPQHSNFHSTSLVKDGSQEADYKVEEHLQQEVVEEVLWQGIIVTCVKRPKGQQMVEL
jgi:hypothetical protein